MGVLVKYTIELEPADLTLIGELLDAQPHGRVQKLVVRMQAQITAQDAAAQTRGHAEWEAQRQKWIADELERRTSEAAARVPVPEPTVAPESGSIEQFVPIRLTPTPTRC